MVHINDLIKQCGTKKATAQKLNVSPTQITRWVKLDAYICQQTGRVWIVTNRSVAA